MVKIFRKHVTRHCRALVKHRAQMVAKAIEGNNPIKINASEIYQFVKGVFQLHKKYSQFVEKKFMDHFLFKNALTEAFQSSCNEQVVGYSFWKFLVAFCDNILTNRNMTSVDVEDALKMIVELFPYVYEEDTIDKIA